MEDWFTCHVSKVEFILWNPTANLRSLLTIVVTILEFQTFRIIPWNILIFDAMFGSTGQNWHNIVGIEFCYIYKKKNSTNITRFVSCVFVYWARGGRVIWVLQRYVCRLAVWKKREWESAVYTGVVILWKIQLVCSDELYAKSQIGIILTDILIVIGVLKIPKGWLLLKSVPKKKVSLRLENAIGRQGPPCSTTVLHL